MSSSPSLVVFEADAERVLALCVVAVGLRAVAQGHLLLGRLGDVRRRLWR